MARNALIPRPEYEADVAKLTRLYEQAFQNLRRELMNTPVDSMSKTQLDAAVRDMASITKRLNIDTASWAKNYIPKAARDGVATARASIGLAPSFATARGSTSFSGLNKRMTEAVMGDLQNDLLQVTQNVDRRVRQAVRSATAEVMRTNMAQGKNGLRTNKAALMNDLRNRLGNTLDTGIIDAAGRRWNPNTYVDMVVRTKMMEANTQGTINEALERGVLYGRVSVHHASDACSKWEGKILKLVPDAPGDFPTVDEARASREIFHPRCGHLVLPERNPPELDELTPEPAVEQTPEPQQPGFIPAKNFDEATAYARDVLGIENPDFSHLSLDTANKTNKMIGELRNTYSASNVRIRTVQTTKDLYRSCGYTRTPANVLGCAAAKKQAIGFTERYFGRNVKAGDSPELVAMSNKRTGWWTTGDPMHVIAHELGHSLYGTALTKLKPLEFNAATSGFDAVRKAASGVGSDVYADLLSKYGMTNYDEFAAEAFAEYTLSEKPREHARKFGEWLKEILNR
jgi:hypothetical protein